MTVHALLTMMHALEFMYIIHGEYLMIFERPKRFKFTKGIHSVNVLHLTIQWHECKCSMKVEKNIRVYRMQMRKEETEEVLYNKNKVKKEQDIQPVQQ